MPDFRWMSGGGILLDSTGDIATCSNLEESVLDIIRSRLKAKLWGWKLYSIGADLELRIGDMVNPELELQIQRQVVDALTKSFLARNDFQVRTFAFGDRVLVTVLRNQQPVYQIQLQRDNPVQVITA